MSIDPLSRGPGAPEELARQAAAQDARREAAAKPRTDAPAAPQDRVEVSAEAKALAALARGEKERSLPLERVHEILARLTTGWYDRPEVTSAVAEKVADELRGSTEA